MSGKHRSVLLALALVVSLSFFAGEASALLHRVGPINSAPSVGNFPSWYQDSTGLTLEFCDPLNQAEVDGGWCLLLPADVTIPEVFPVNFFDEHFWYAADADAIDGSPNSPLKKAILVMAVEAAFGADVVRPGDQVAFARIRIRLEDVPVTGTYRFIHPYGEEVVEGVAGDRIFATEDIGIACAPGDFSCALQSRLGPFLLPSDAPGGAELPAVAGPVPGKLYIADPARSGPVTGSPTGNNLFRIEGPPGSNLDGAGNDFLETTNFTLMGRIFTGPIPGEVTVNRASYTGNDAEQKVDVYATGFETTQGRLPAEPPAAAVLPQLSFFDAPCAASGLDDNGDPIPPFSAPAGAAEIPMANAGNDFWGQVPVAAIPAGVCVKDNVTLAYFPKGVGDTVTITEAFFNPGAQSLSVKAFSSDATVPPTLTLGGFGELADGAMVVSPLAAPPATVRVFSDAGGVNEAQVTTNPPPVAPAPPPATGVSLFSVPASPQFAGPAVTFVASGSGGGTGYEYKFWFRSSTGAWNVVQDYSTASTWTWDTSAVAPDTYFVQVDVRSIGSTAFREAAASMAYVINPAAGPATGVTLSAAPASPQPAGTSVSFTGSGIGGTGTYEYKFWLRSATGSWAVVQNYSASSTWTWNTTGSAAGTYFVEVDVRNAGSTAFRDAAATTSFVAQ